MESKLAPNYRPKEDLKFPGPPHPPYLILLLRDKTHCVAQAGPEFTNPSASASVGSTGGDCDSLSRSSFTPRRMCAGVEDLVSVLTL